MIPCGWLAKRVAPRDEFLAAVPIVDVWSVSGCISADFGDYIGFWRHNGHWLFDAPQTIREARASTASTCRGPACSSTRPRPRVRRTDAALVRVRCR